MNVCCLQASLLKDPIARRDRAVHAVRFARLSAIRSGGALALAAWIVVVGQGHLAAAATLSFIPAGGPLDVDPINDLIPAVGAAISFEVMIDTAGLPGPLETFSYTASWDAAELERTGLVMDGGMPGAGGNFAVDTPPMLFNPVGSTVAHAGGAIPAGGGAVLLDRWDFTVLPGLVNDGLSDFRVEIFSANSRVGGVLVGVLPNYAPAFQQVEVQPGDVGKIPEPSAITLAGTLLAAASGFVRRGTKQPPACI